MGGGAARGELVGDGPAGGFAGEAQAALLGDGVDLDDDAVDLVGKRVAELFCLGDEGKDFVEVVDGFGVGVDAEACAAQGGESRVLDTGARSRRRAEEEVGVELEAALGDDAGFDRADGAGGGVAGVGGGGLAGGFALGVHLLESGF